MVCSNIANFWTIGDCSNKQVINISSSVVRSISTSNTITLQQSTSANVVLTQNQDVNIVNLPEGYSVNIGQLADVKFDSNTTSQQNSVVQTINKLQTELTNSLEQKMEQKLGVLAAGSKAGDQFTNIKNKVTSILNNQNTINTISDNVTNVISIQTSKIEITFAPTTQDPNPVQNQLINDTMVQNKVININQTTLMDVQVTATIEQVADVLNRNEDLVTMLNDVKQDLKQEVAGLDAIVESVMGFFKSGIFVIGLIILALIIGGVAIFYIFFQNPENVKTITGAATEISKNAGGPKGMGGKL
jgi:hypothetical protein